MSDDAIHEAEAAAGQALTFLAPAAGWSWRAKIEAGIGVLILIAAVLTWALWPPKPVPEVVQPRAEVHQADGSDMAATLPPSSPEAQALPPPRAQLPKGAKVERRDRIVAQPVATAASACPPVTVDLQTVRTTDGGRRVIASSPDGAVLSAVDVPIDPAPLPPPEKPWAAGLSYGTDRAVGIFVERDIGRLRAGIEVERAPAGRAEARIRLGVRF